MERDTQTIAPNSELGLGDSSSPTPTAEPLRKQLKDAFLNWLETSTSHGLPNLVRTSSIVIKIMWAIVFLIGLGAATYFLVITLVNYFQYQVVVQIAVIQKTPTNFPAITICNLNRFNLNSVNDQNRTSLAYINRLLILNNLTTIDSLNDTDNQIFIDPDADSLVELIDDGTYTLKKLVATDRNLTFGDKASLGYDLELDMLLSCTWNNFICDSDDFTMFIDNEYGNCYTFNGGFDAYDEKQDILTTNRVGSKYGLDLELVIADEKDIKFAISYGIVLVVHNQTKLPVTIHDGDGIYLAAGFETYVSVTREFRYKLDKPYSKCIKNLDTPENDYGQKLFAYMKDYNLTTYDQEFCNTLCYQDKLITKCGCQDPMRVSIGNARYCRGTDDNCVDYFSEDFSTQSLDTLCESACQIQCETVVYHLSTHTANYPTDYYLDLLEDDEDARELIDFSRREDFKMLRVRVNYDDLAYTVIQEVPSSTVDSVVGIIGGQFGLFIGISLMSVIEILEIIMEFTRIIYLNKSRRKKVNNKSNAVNVNPI